MDGIGGTAGPVPAVWRFRYRNKVCAANNRSIRLTTSSVLGRVVNRAIDSAATEQRAIGRFHNGIDRKPCDAGCEDGDFSWLGMAVFRQELNLQARKIGGKSRPP